AHKHADSSTLPGIALAPGAYSSVLIKDFGVVMANQMPYASAPHLLPPVEQVVFPRNPALVSILVLASVIAAAVAVVLGVFRRRHALAAVTGAIFVLSFVTSVGGHMYMAYELNRLGMQEAIMLRVCLVVWLAAAIDCAMERRTAKHTRGNALTQPCGETETVAR
ncbi:MAG: hypothetical protein ACRDQZ_17070, partial [Mycobacteriales bacterium]